MGVGHPRNHNRRDKVTIGLITCCASKVGRLRVKLGTFPFPEGYSNQLSYLPYSPGVWLALQSHSKPPP
ncbi:MAG: hypothetical protein BJ554DRAFT_1885 [Olpidium bornovanus]|uniref:Uncharacterized protein n=1 Tax=Olpidium bornovanus TaxID=278681 RepID=A0A8H8DGV2_9FUNG|nr:MAG: hypothetical protein BJ554DRAFT_1885 [Olpidium bornovanus]